MVSSHRCVALKNRGSVTLQGLKLANPVIRPPAIVDHTCKEMSDFCVATPVILPLATVDNTCKDMSDSVWQPL